MCQVDMKLAGTVMVIKRDCRDARLEAEACGKKVRSQMAELITECYSRVRSWVSAHALKSAHHGRFLLVLEKVKAKEDSNK